ncbi:hypothetical protein [Chryseobacterium sp. PMSZPI]|uniref:hypothetical protein n=1 Tax=Chryseobacterium sp. PMSZPI TaxID=1033900 RepID=UPI000C33DFD1|nr:hypothetical protein [Chryseobacterium sp. PMSZPI]PKF74547.1 hypothetical protein CW752_08800 [Chryseobacterium sp. PMSZPI]
MISSLKFKNEYYSIFQEDQLYYMGHSQKYLVKYNISGEILGTVILPEDLSRSYYLDFFMSDNQLYIQQNNNERYIFDINTNKFIKTTKGDDLVYTDNNYKVMYKSFGEWGQATWFINKKNKSEHFTSLNGQDINFLFGKFHITNVSSIWEIRNPKELNKCNSDQYYNVINNKKNGIFTSYDYVKGIKLIYRDTIEFDPYVRNSIDKLNYAFITSFVTNNNLYQITQLKDKTAISKVSQNKVEIVKEFNEKYRFFSWHNQFRNKQNKYKFLKFQNGYNSFGFFEVNDNNIDITKVNYTHDTIQYIKSDSIVQLLSFLSDKNAISKKEIINFEKKTKGTDLQKRRNSINHNSYFPKKFNKIEVETINYLKSENEYITQNIDYLFVKKDEMLKAIFLDWDKTIFVHSVGKDFYPIRNENYLESDKRFREKYSEIQEQLNKIGKQVKVTTPSDKIKYNAWIFNGWRINLYGISEKNIYGIRALICRQDDFNENE